MITCECQLVDSDQAPPQADAFDDVRRGCIALRHLLAPDDVWPSIAADAKSPNAALHRSCLLLAFERGHLAKLTWPVHKFLCDDSGVRPAVVGQYRSDLREHWLLEPDPVRRHERFRRFFGKVVELQVAAWLAEMGWHVSGLEALGARSDIEARSPDGTSYVIEVKYIGQTTEDFTDVVEALSGGTVAGSKPLYGAINYLLYRVYEAARSLRRQSGARLAIIVIDAQSWYAFNAPLKHAWLNWQKPGFLATAEGGWNDFLLKSRNTNPAIDAEVEAFVQELDAVWVARLNGAYEYSLEHQLTPAG